MSSSSITNGWVKLHRSLLEWEWWDDLKTMRVFIFCLLRANPNDKRWKGKVVKKGTFITSRAKLSVECNLSEREVRTALSHLESTGELTIETTNEYTIITICNYDKYQLQDDTERPTKRPTTDQRPTNDRPATDQRPTTNKESEEYKESEEEIITPPARVRAREGEFASGSDTQATAQTDRLAQPESERTGADCSGQFYTEYRSELAGQTENAVRAQRQLQVSAQEVVALLDEYQDMQKLRGDPCTSRRDYRQHFILWAKKMLEIKQDKERKRTESKNVRLGADEWIDKDGRRTYGSGKFTVPNDAPPRPSVKHVWVNSDHQWMIL